MTGRRRVWFFFSSRRRHTRCGRDWSSDVCSSDLGPHSQDRDKTAEEDGFAAVRLEQIPAEAELALVQADILAQYAQEARATFPTDQVAEVVADHRSEERRVGKECSSRREAETYKK